MKLFRRLVSVVLMLLAQSGYASRSTHGRANEHRLDFASTVTRLRARGGGGTYHLKQYITGEFCTGRYVALDLTVDQMIQLHLPDGRSPGVLCNKLERSDGNSFVVHSCAGDDTSGCPNHCDECREDLVKHFDIDVCSEGWMLKAGSAPEDCDTDHKECVSKNRVDVGLARWCDKWPTPTNASNVSLDTAD
eukprot:TRINITY_DN67467_c0_g1_i1.p1 TRINITY_DN67467_c0_g1~~TRINITY_DN67467_c0_g1_i1.p1  ORF type:complete len:191 (-),score=24.70 TRINITY_DN67467_c0_g1_i1:107-679(-)